MPGWTLVDTHPTQGRTFQRVLNSSGEYSFFRESVSNGATDFLRYLKLRLSNGVRDVHLFSDANIMHAWKSTKRRFPLAGASILRKDVEHDGDNGIDWVPYFVLRERDLSAIGPRDIVFGQVADVAEAQRRAAAILDGPRQLSDDVLVQLHVLRETSSETARTDVLYVIVLIAHCLGDGISSRTLMRCFLDTLARGREPSSEPAQIPLEDRLAMMVPMEELEPVHLRAPSPARRRWRKAIAGVIVQMKFEKRQGGQALPWRRTRSTPYSIARSGLVETSLSQSQTTDVISKCRQHKVTFGSTYLVLAQLAMTRVLYRRRLRGEISEEEWEYRKRQPYIIDAPINIRSCLDKAWFERGGGGDLIFAINGFRYQLPFMTLGGTGRRQDTMDAFSDGAPPFSDLFTFDRLLHRIGLVKKQTAAFFGHPLFFEIMHAMFQKALNHHVLFSQKMKKSNLGNDLGGEPLSIMDMPTVVAHTGSSLGNIDSIFPLEYPLSDTHPLSPYSCIPHPHRAGYVTPLEPKVDMTPVGPTIAVECERTHLHVRPGGIYLGALTLGGQLKMFVYFDRNVFEDDIVEEWLNEVKEAVLWFQRCP